MIFILNNISVLLFFQIQQQNLLFLKYIYILFELYKKSLEKNIKNNKICVIASVSLTTKYSFRNFFFY